MGRNHWARLCRLAISVAALPAAAIDVVHEYRRRIESAQNLTALKDDLPGDSVSLYNGNTEFSVVDIDVRGNSLLPLQARRHIPVDFQPSNAGAATSQ